MQIIKTYCDCCGVEFTKTDDDYFGDIDVNVIIKKQSGKTNRKIIRFKSGDVCGLCAKKIYKFIKELKK